MRDLISLFSYFDNVERVESHFLIFVFIHVDNQYYTTISITIIPEDYTEDMTDRQHK